jgi:hypothetical protein
LIVHLKQHGIAAPCALHCYTTNDFSISRPFGWRLFDTERLDGVEQEEVNADLCGALRVVGDSGLPVRVVADLDVAGIVRDAFYSGPNQRDRLVDGNGRTRAIRIGTVFTVVNHRG